MSEPEHPKITYEFGPFRLDVAEYLLTRNGRRLSLQPKVFELLVILVQRQGHTIEKERLMQALWPDVSVEESSLTQLICQLRKSLGENAATQAYIETIPKRGYRFVADATVSSEAVGDLLITSRESTRIVIDQVEETDDQPSTNENMSVATLVGTSRQGRWAGIQVSLTTLLLLFAGAACLILVIGSSLILWSPKHKARKSATPFQDVKFRKLTTSGKAVLPAVSPDGKFAAYVSDGDGGQAIWVVQVSTHSRVQIAQRSDVVIRGLTFSTDGQTLYYVEKRKDQPSGLLYQIPVLGGTAREVMREVDSPITFAPDGKRFSFVRGNLINGPTQLMIAAVNGEEVRSLAVRNRPDFFLSYGPAWSPNGSVIACGVGRSDSQQSYRQVVTVNVADGKELPLGTQTWVDMGQVAWLSDGSGVVVNAWPLDSEVFARQIWYITYPSGQAQRVLRDLSSYKGVSAASKSEVIAVGRSDRVSRIWVAPSIRTADAQLISSSMSDNHSEVFGLAWTSSGKLVYSSHASGNSDIWMMDGDGRGQRQLTFDSPKETWPVVSPDDRYIVFTSQGPNGVHIWRIDVDGGNRKQLTFGKGESFPGFSPDGRWVYFTSMDPGWPVIGRVSIDGGETTLLTKARAGRPVVSPDGKTVACLYFDETADRMTVGIIPAEGGEPIRLFRDFPAPDWFSLQWTGDGKGLAYISTKNGVSNIWVQPIAGGPPRQLTEFSEDRIYRFAWTRDGERIAIDRGLDVNDIVLLNDF